MIQADFKLLLVVEHFDKEARTFIVYDLSDGAFHCIALEHLAHFAACAMPSFDYEAYGAGTLTYCAMPAHYWDPFKISYPPVADLGVVVVGCLTVDLGYVQQLMVTRYRSSCDTGPSIVVPTGQTHAFHTNFYGLTVDSDLDFKPALMSTDYWALCLGHYGKLDSQAA